MANSADPDQKPTELDLHLIVLGINDKSTLVGHFV